MAPHHAAAKSTNKVSINAVIALSGLLSSFYQSQLPIRNMISVQSLSDARVVSICGLFESMSAVVEGDEGDPMFKNDPAIEIDKHG